MKRILLVAALSVILCSPIMALEWKGQVDQNDVVIISLLRLVIQDLHMCRASLSQNVLDNVSALGHLNNAQSALKKAIIDASYVPLVQEIQMRISKAKFYLVMGDFRAVDQRLFQLIGVIHGVLGANYGNNGAYGNGNYNNNGYGYGGTQLNPTTGQGTTVVPMLPVEKPVGGSPSNGGMLTPQVPSLGVPIH